MDTWLNLFHNAFPYRKTLKYTYVSSYGSSAAKGIQTNHAHGIFCYNLVVFMHVISAVLLQASLNLVSGLSGRSQLQEPSSACLCCLHVGIIWPLSIYVSRDATPKVLIARHANMKSF